MQRRSELLPPLGGRGRARPLMVWEPVPELCLPEELAKFKIAVQHVDVLSPNAEELAGFFTNEDSALSETQIAEKILGWGISPSRNGALVVRQGKEGCAIYCGLGFCHLRPYHTTSPKVLDPTGGGNAFLGALTLAMVDSVYPSTSVVDDALADAKVESSGGFGETERRLLCASIYATVAASFVIEQPGMPILERGTGRGIWNGQSFEDRLFFYVGREGEYITQQLVQNKSLVSS